VAPSAASPAPAVARVPSVWACLPAAPLIVCWLVWVPLDGGYFPRQWYPGALIAVGVLVATAAGLRRLLPAGRPVRVALIAFAALTALQYASLLWTNAPGDAWEAANQLLLALATAWTFALLPWTPARLAAVAATWATGVAIVCLDRMLVASSATSLGRFFDPTTSRWQAPIGYPNAAAALGALALIAALVCSARTELPAWARIPLVGAAAFLAQFALLPQTRAAIVGVAAAAVAVVVADGRRRRLIPRMLVVGGAVAWTASRVIDVGQAAEDGKPVGSLIDTATRGVVIATVVAIVVAGLIEIVEYLLARRAGDRPPRELPVLGPRGGLIAAGVVLLVLVVVGIAAGPSIYDKVSDRASSASNEAVGGNGQSRLLSAEPEERLDYARVALRMFRDRPVLGTGSGSFPIHYDRLRKYEKHSRYEHMIFLRVLGETGIVGLLAFLTMIGGLLVAFVVDRRRLTPSGRGMHALALGLGVYLLTHASLDWIDEFAAIAAPVAGLAFAGAVVARPQWPGGGPEQGWIVPAAATGVVVAALLVLVPPYLSDRYVRRAVNSYRAHPDQALRDTERAASANPLSLDPLVAEGTICLQIRRFTCADQAFEAAAAQQDNWYSWLELGLLDARAGRRAESLRDLAHARQLSRVDPMVTEARLKVTAGKRVDPTRFNQQVVTASPIFRVNRIRR
jgi:hypothetical protein